MPDKDKRELERRNNTYRRNEKISVENDRRSGEDRRFELDRRENNKG